MEREDGVQANNGSPKGQGQRTGKRKLTKNAAAPVSEQAILGPPPTAGVPPMMQTPGQQVSGPTYPIQQVPPASGAQFSPQPMPPQAQGPQVNPAAILGTGMQDRKALGGYAGRGSMMGFNTAMDYPDDKAANSMKNTFGRIASRYDSNPGSMDAIFNDPDFQRFFPGAKRVEGGAGDKIDFGGMLSDFESGVPVGVVDVGGAFDPKNNTGAGWTWQDLVNDVQGPAPGQAIYNQAQNQMGQQGGVETQQMLEGMDENSLMELLRQLMGPQGPEDSGGGYV
jgi:hypothetical protein